MNTENEFFFSTKDGNDKIPANNEKIITLSASSFEFIQK